MDDQGLLAICSEVVDAVAGSLEGVKDWEREGERPGQYGLDLIADAAALAVLDREGLGVLSEESGLRRGDAELIAVIDPVDGSTNASRRVPWYACSICVLDRTGPLVSVVANLASGVRYTAVRGGGAFKDGVAIAPSGCSDLGDALIALSGYPRERMGWSQYRVFGAAALDMCAVAEGMIDAYATVGKSSLGAWDYMGAMLVCTEAGAAVGETNGLDLVTTEHSDRRTAVAASTPRLLGQVIEGALAARPKSDELGPGSGS
jgi:myo-inositol-1(or 4)-monophosphatase